MLLIESVRYRKTQRDEVTISHAEPVPVADWSQSSTIAKPRIRLEHIRGELFTLPDGTTHCIGMTEYVQKALGIPMRAFRDMSEQVAKQQKSLRGLLDELQAEKLLLNAFTIELIDLTLWERIKFLFGWNPSKVIRARAESWSMPSPIKENE